MDLLLHPQSGPWPDAPPTPTSLPAPVPAPEPPRTSRCKLWDIHHKYHCPVIGTCLEVASCGASPSGPGCAATAP